MYRKPYINMYLKNDFSYTEAKDEVDFIIEILFNYTYKDYILGKTLNDLQKIKIENVINERINTKRPIQQIVGQSFFYSRRFFVNEFTLIPRPETEILVKETLNLLSNLNHADILDIGTGSGCIPITLTLESDIIFADAVDISFEAIEIAKKNSIFHNVENKINFFCSDIFENVKKQYDFIISNPPYIPLKDKESLQIEVKNFEPALALFAKDDYGVEFYEKIIKNIHDYLKPGGYVLFEIGINQSELLKDILLKNYLTDIKIIKDNDGINRVVIAKK